MTYTSDTGLCLGFDLVYWNYPVKVFEFHDQLTGAVSAYQHLFAQDA